MSKLIINRLLKPLIRHRNVRLFSTQTYPYLLVDHILNTVHSHDDLITSPDGRFQATTLIYNLSGEFVKDQEILIKDEELADELIHAMTLGFYNNGGVMRYTMSELHSLLTIHYRRPSDPKAEPVSVDLPLPTGSQLQYIAMSSPPDLDNKEWTVAVKLSGSQVRLHRPAIYEWFDIQTVPGSITPFSTLMYSKKDEKFYIPTLGGQCLCTLDLQFKQGDHPEFTRMYNTSSSRSLLLYDSEEIKTDFKTDHLVDSPTGEKFRVQWYWEESYENIKGVCTLVLSTKGFMVYRTDLPKDRNGFRLLSYTNNIGDLCIFLGHSEAFCVPASSSPGLKPNCIYFVGHSFGVYDITAKRCTTFFTKDGPLTSTEFPYWPSPALVYS